jgi:hypothetical protein
MGIMLRSTSTRLPDLRRDAAYLSLRPTLYTRTCAGGGGCVRASALPGGEADEGVAGARSTEGGRETRARDHDARQPAAGES